MIAIVDTGAGNLASVKRAFDRLNQKAVVTSDLFTVYAADRIVLPGVGTARVVMDNLRGSGLDRALMYKREEGCPILGICIGIQVFMEHSEEGDTDCLGWIEGEVSKLESSRVPHVGWNNVCFERQHPVMRGITDDHYFYFVHSYRPIPKNDEDIVGFTWYEGVPFVSVIGRENVIAVQFHVEKSGSFGMSLLDNYCRWGGKWE